MAATDLDVATPASNRDGSKAESSRREPGHKLQQRLRADIVAGRIPAGSRLKVSDIIARYSTSTNPAREALHALEGEGLVVITPNRGARVRSVDADFVSSMFDIRLLIEPYIVRWFTEYATTEDRKALEDVQKKVQEAVDAGDLHEFQRHNRDFHDLFVSRHFNTEAARILRTQNAWLRLLTSEFPPAPLQMARSSAEHWELVAAINSFNAELAADIIRKHGEWSHANLMGRMRRKRSERPAGDN